jgi:hypothetical protein
MLSPQVIERRFDSLSARRVNFETTWQEISDHIRGDRDFNTKRTPGQVRTRLVYDSTGMFSWEILSSALQNFLFNPETEWFDLGPEDPNLAKLESVREWCWNTRNTLKALVERPEAGLVGQLQEFLSDYVGYCTAAMIIEDEPGLPVRFSHRPLGEIFVAENAAGLIETVYRKYCLTHHQAVVEFGAENLPKIAEQVKGQPEQETEFLQAFYRANDPVLGDGGGGKPWRCVYYSRHEKRIVLEKGLDENPVVVARWKTYAGEVYGRGPGWTALPEQRMLNAMTKTLIEGAQLAVRPPYLLADDSVIHPLNLNPGGPNQQRSTAFAVDPIKFLETTGDHRLAVEMFDRRKSAVRSAFMHDLLELLQQLIPTAQQVIEIVSRARSLFAPTLGRLQAEAIEPMLNRAFRIALRANAFPPPPPELANAKLKVAYRNPVSRSQKQSDGQALDSWISFIANLAQVEPSILDNVDWDAVARVRHEIAGTAPEVLRGEDEMAARRDAARQMAEEQAEQANAMATAEAAGKMAPALKVLQGGAAA